MKYINLKMADAPLPYDKRALGRVGEMARPFSRMRGIHFLLAASTIDAHQLTWPIIYLSLNPDISSV